MDENDLKRIETIEDDFLIQQGLSLLINHIDMQLNFLKCMPIPDDNAGYIKEYFTKTKTRICELRQNRHQKTKNQIIDKWKN